jgi:hypothetical protein
MTMHIICAMTVIRRRMTLGPLLLASLLLASCGGGGGGGGSSGSAPPVTTPPSNLQYPAAPTFVVGTAITALTPTVVGEVTNYGVSPALPAGLSFNTTTGVISGTPTGVAAKAIYTVEATNAGGGTTAPVSIGVMAAATTAPSDLHYPTSPTLVAGTKMAPLTPTVVGQVTSYSVSPILPAGLSLNTTAGVISGTPTDATAKTDYTVTATNAAGSTRASVSIVVMATAPTYTAKSGVAQKGPLIQGSAVTVQELDPSLSPTGQQFSYQILTNFGTFSPTSTFTSQYLGLIATGYYFDEVADVVSTGPVTLYAYSDLAADSVLNVNLLTTLEYQRIQNLVTQSNMTFAAARAQAETEVLAALNIPAAGYGSFDSLNLTGNSDGDYILAAISSLFVYGNSAGPLSALIASFQSDIGTNGVITNPATAAALTAAAKGINPSTVAANLTQYYASQGLTFTAANISDWIAQSGDGVIGRDAFSVPDATPSTAFAFPPYVVSQFAGLPVSVTVGQLTVNGTAVNGTVSFNKGDVVALSPSVGSFPNGVLTSYLVTGQKNLARVSFVSGLVSIAVTPSMPSVPLGVTQQFTATGTFSDTSTADLTSSVAWTSGAPAVASINANAGLANPLTVGSTVITATSGSVSGSTTLTATPAALQSITITPNPIRIGPGSTQQLTATGTYSDGTTQNVTSAANWTSDTPSVATIGPSTGLATGVSVGTATISATIGSITATASLSVVTVVSIAIAPNPITTGVGINQQLIATGTYLDGTVQTVTASANWTSDTPSVATVGPTTGLVTGVANGSATISATIGSVTGKAPLTVVTDTWIPTANMATDRALHTATMLPNGKVLVAGGNSPAPSPTGSAEIYDPVTATWTATGNMTVPRQSHVATLLPNGTVLVAGGEGGVPPSGGSAAPFSVQASAEIYVNGGWIATGSMTRPRAFFTLTLLPNGKVLAAGGLDGVDTANGTSAEIYDPATGQWTATGSMTTARNSHTATLLPNGTVLVSGGTWQVPPDGLSSAEIYDPAAGTWTVTGNMTAARNRHTASLLPNGTVLVAGGYNQVGGTFTELASAEIYDPSAGTWTITGSMPTPCYAHTATALLNGTILAAGGCGASAEIYDPVAATWAVTGSMTVQRASHAETLLPDGAVLVTGGNGGIGASAEIFSP